MRPCLLVLLLLAGVAAAKDKKPPVPFRDSPLASVDLDPSALTSETPVSRRRARATLNQAVEQKLAVQISSDPRVSWFVPASTLVEDKARVEQRALMLVERGELDEALWELARAGSTGALRDSVARLHSCVHGGASAPASVAAVATTFAPGDQFVVAYGETLVVERRVQQAVRIAGLRAGRTIWEHELGSEVFGHVYALHGRRLFAARVDRITALDVETGALQWSFTREAFKVSDESGWHLRATCLPVTLTVTLDAVTWDRGPAYPTERLDPASGRLLEVKPGSLGLDVPTGRVRMREG